MHHQHNHGIVARCGLLLLLSAVLFSSWAQVSSALINSTNAAIDTIRKRNCAITITGSNGTPLSGVAVSVKQVRHHFGFGAALPYSILNDTNLQKVFLDNFEWAVFENDLKWPSTDPTATGPDYSRPDSLLGWCRKNDIKVRAHCLFWNQDTGKIPEWTRNLNATAFQAAVDARINNAITHYKGKVEQWDIGNEVIHGTVLETKTGNSNIWNSIFNKARNLDSSVGLAINDFNIIERYSDTGKYIAKIKAIRTSAPIDVIGLEGHFGKDLVQTDYKSKIDKMATVGLPMWITEMDFSVAMNVRCDRFEELLRTAFAQPRMEGFTMWVFWQGNRWRDDLTSYIADSATYAINDLGQRYRSLLNLWTTTTNGTTGANGSYSFRGFHGKYVVTTTVAGIQQTDTVYLEPGQGTRTVTIAGRTTRIVTNRAAPSAAYLFRVNGVRVAIGSAPGTLGADAVSLYTTSGRLIFRQRLDPKGRDISLDAPAGCYIIGIGKGTKTSATGRISFH